MRVTSHCANHPSKEAGQRCRSCGLWLCDVCARRYGRRIYCGRGCQIRDRIRGWVDRASEAARRPVHPAWAVTISAAASAVLLAVLGLIVAEMIEIQRGGSARESSPLAGGTIEARIDRDEGKDVLVVRGPPAARVALLRDDQPARLLTLDEDGTATLKLESLESDGERLRLLRVVGSDLELERPAAAARDPAPVAETSLSEARARERPRTGGGTARAAVERPQVAPPVLQFVTDGGSRIAITFDGNASSHRTTELLDVLAELDLEVSLFVTGTFIERYPGIVRRAVLAGHEFGNHTYSHPHLTTYATDRRHSLHPGITRERLQLELRRTEEAFRAATGRAMRPLWRAPYGEENRTIRGWALEAGYLHVRWSSLQGASLDSRDWVADEHSKLYEDSTAIMRRLLRFPELRGGVVLMHMSTQRNRPPWEELPAFVRELERRGVRPTTVSELLEASPTWRPWLRRAETRHREVYGR